MNELTLNKISKKLDEQVILESINGKLANGITGIVGLNGAGKTTLLKIISGLLKSDTGSIEYNGKQCKVNSALWRRKLGYLSQSPGLYERMNVYSFLDYMLILSGWKDRIKRKRRILEISDVLKLTAYLKKNIGFLSGGIKQKVAIAQAVIHDPPVLLLDEPANNLDNDERENLHKFLLHISKDKIILVVEHILDELPIICDRILVLKKGGFIFDGTPVRLIEVNKDYIREIVIPRAEYLSHVRQKGLLSFRSVNGSFVLRIDIRMSDIKHGIKIVPNFSEALRATYNSNEFNN